MSYVTGIDVSRWQGNIDWNAVPHPIAIIKMSGGDDGLYFDAKANQNYYAAQRAGKHIGMYHFAGGTDPIAEADYFIQACSPLAENDVLILDWETQHPDPVGWCTQFVNRVHDRATVWPLIYFNGSTYNSYNWTPVTNNCGVWVAWYGRDPESTLPTGPYIMHQFSSTGAVPGIAGNVDMDAWFGTLEQFDRYGYHASQLAPTPAPEPVPEPSPQPTPVPDVTPLPEPVPATPAAPSPPQISPLKVAIIGLIAAAGLVITAFLTWLHN